MRKILGGAARAEIEKLYEKEGKGREEAKKKLDSQVQKMMDDYDNMCQIYKTQSNLGVLQNVLLQEHHRVLAPLLMLNMKKNSCNVDNQNEAKEGFKANLGFGKKIVAKEKNMNIPSAYQTLVNSNPQNELERQINKFFIQNLPQMTEQVTASLDCSEFVELAKVKPFPNLSIEEEKKEIDEEESEKEEETKVKKTVTCSNRCLVTGQSIAFSNNFSPIMVPVKNQLSRKKKIRIKRPSRANKIHPRSYSQFLNMRPASVDMSSMKNADISPIPEGP